MKKLSILLVSLGIIILISGCSNKQKEEAYLKDLKKLAEASHTLAFEAEASGIEYLKVWKNTIYNKRVTIDGKTYYDFNDSLYAEKKFLEKAKVFEVIDKKTDDANAIYKNIKDQKVEKYSEEYKKTKDFYLKSVEFKDICLTPKGSYNDYSDNFSKTRDEISSMYSSLKIELDIE